MMTEQQVPDVPTITRDEVRQLVDRDVDFTLVEALPEEDYEEYHLPGARHLPLDDVRERASDVIPDRQTPVVVYCANEDCPASPRATQILLEMGYENVRDYEAGKEDWKEAGLPVETGQAEVASA